MRATTTMAAASTLLLAGCSGLPPLSGPPPDCPVTSSVTVGHGPGRLVVMPDCITVDEETEVTVSFSPTPAPGIARTKYRGVGNRWLDRRNDEGPNPARIVVVPPPGSGSGGDRDRGRPYKYEIHVEGVGILDPRIIVR